MTIEMGEEVVVVAHRWPRSLDELLHLPRLLRIRTLALQLSVQVMKLTMVLLLLLLLLVVGERELMIIVDLHGCKMMMSSQV